jgi:hypothetical protein
VPRRQPRARAFDRIRASARSDPKKGPVAAEGRLDLRNGGMSDTGAAQEAVNSENSQIARLGVEAMVCVSSTQGHLPEQAPVPALAIAGCR